MFFFFKFQSLSQALLQLRADMVTTAEENVQVGWRILLNYLTQWQVTRPIFLKMIVEHNDDGLTYDLVYVF